MNTPKTTEVAEAALRARAAILRGDIARELGKRDEENFARLAGEITDRSDESVADLLVDVTLAEISRDIAELGEVEAALERIAAGTYGICADCDADIEPHRLEAVPAARRCFACQTALEARDPHEHPRL